MRNVVPRVNTEQIVKSAQDIRIIFAIATDNAKVQEPEKGMANALATRATKANIVSNVLMDFMNLIKTKENCCVRHVIVPAKPHVQEAVQKNVTSAIPDGETLKEKVAMTLTNVSRVMIAVLIIISVLTMKGTILA